MRTKYWVSVLAVSVVLLSVPSISTIYAQTDSIQINEDNCKKLEPLDYHIGILVTTIGEIDKKTGSYELIFVLTVVSDKIDFTKCPPPSQWVFTNGYVKSMWGEFTEPHFHKVIIHGVFFDEFDFRNYPFEEIDLSIQMGPGLPLTSENTQFSANEEFSGLSIAERYVSGYDVGNIQLEISETQVPWGTFPHLSAIIPLTNDPGTIFMKKIFPAIILAGFGYSTFFMSPKILQDRIAIIGAVLVGAIFFHAVFLLGEIPPLGYLTIADKVMITVYSVFSFTLLTVLLQQRYLNSLNNTDENYIISIGKNVDKKLIKLTPLFAIMIFFGLLLY